MSLTSSQLAFQQQPIFSKQIHFILYIQDHLSQLNYSGITTSVLQLVSGRSLQGLTVQGIFHAIKSHLNIENLELREYAFVFLRNLLHFVKATEERKGGGTQFLSKNFSECFFYTQRIRILENFESEQRLKSQSAVRTNAPTSCFDVCTSVYGCKKTSLTSGQFGSNNQSTELNLTSNYKEQNKNVICRDSVINSIQQKVHYESFDSAVLLMRSMNGIEVQRKKLVE